MAPIPRDDPEKHPDFLIPTNKRVRIWRYTDFAKFVSCLAHSGLYSSRVTHLDDKFEGTFSRGNVALRPIVYGNAIPAEGFAQIHPHLQASRSSMVVNCWHMNEYESAAMWRLYSRSNESIAFQATYERLRAVLPWNLFIGEVSYIDYGRDWLPEGNLFHAFMHKRRSFEHERELRAITDLALPMNSDLVPSTSGVWVPVDMRHLLERVFVAPTSSAWFKELVEEILSRYGYDVPVSQSDLDAEPLA